MKVESKLGSVKKVHLLGKQKQKAKKYVVYLSSRLKRDNSGESSQTFKRKKGNIFYEFLLFYKQITLLDFLYNNRKAMYLVGLVLMIGGVFWVQFHKTLDRYNIFAAEQSVYDVASTLENDRVAPETTFTSGVSTDVVDKRVYVLEEYFRANNSPLEGTGQLFVDACDEYGAPVDCISLVAIAKHETDLCKYHISHDMRNCLGWGGGGIYRVTFNSYEHMINTATDVLVNQYGTEYMDDPRLMETVFCGPQAECYGWGDRVLRIMRSIDDFSYELGVGRLTDLREDGLRY